MSDSLTFLEDGFEALVVLQQGAPAVGKAAIARITVEDGAVCILADAKYNGETHPVRATVRYEGDSLTMLIANADDDGHFIDSFKEAANHEREVKDKLLAACEKALVEMIRLRRMDDGADYHPKYLLDAVAQAKGDT